MRNAFCSILLIAAAAAGPSPLQAQDTDLGRLIVLNKSEASASILDVASGKQLALLPTGVGPHEIAVTPDQRYGVVADYGQQTPGKTLTVLDLHKLSVASTIELPKAVRPHGLAFEPDGKHLWLTAEVDQEAWRVSFPKGDVVQQVKTHQGATHMVVYASDGGVYTANIGSGTMTAIDASTGTAKSYETGAGAEGIAVSADGSRVWVSNRASDTLSVFDAKKGEVIAELECPGFPIRVYLTPDGRHAVVSCARAGEIAVYDTASLELRGRIGMSLEAADEGQDRLFGNVFGDSPVPIGVALHPDSRHAFVANAGADKVAVVDLKEQKVLKALATGKEPDGIAWVPSLPAPKY